MSAQVTVVVAGETHVRSIDDSTTWADVLGDFVAGLRGVAVARVDGLVRDVSGEPRRRRQRRGEPQLRGVDVDAADALAVAISASNETGGSSYDDLAPSQDGLSQAISAALARQGGQR